jgi:hypothetical protein
MTLKVETFAWMKPITAMNTGKTYYMIGQVVGMKDTLLVTEKGGNGGTVMFCQQHFFSYPIKGTCDECRNAVLPVAIEASATTCGTPEFER